MKFEEALAALKDGKCIAEVGHRFPEAYMKMVDGEPHWHNFGGQKAFRHMQFRWEEMQAEWKVVDEAEHQKLAPVGTHRCGRREPFFPGDPRRPPYGDGGVEMPDHYRSSGDGERCSYCGSVSGDAFMAFVRAGGEVGPTDKNYKAYLHDTKDDSGLTVRVKAPGMKFYFQHLSEEQKMEFIGLLNAKAVKIGYPGHFYRLPYFCQRVSAMKEADDEADSGAGN